MRMFFRVGAAVVLLAAGALFAVHAQTNETVTAAAGSSEHDGRTAGDVTPSPSESSGKPCEAPEGEHEVCANGKPRRHEREDFMADCVAADAVGLWPNTCAEAAEPVAEKFSTCRSARKTLLECENAAVHEACFYRGGGAICGDSEPVYQACRTRGATDIARSFCIEGTIEYQKCRHAFGVTVSGDVCVPATAAYENCRAHSSIHACQGVRDEYARTHYR
ncbi:hypothetical protein [Nonomuraea turcica]|uniref:hypothetical protein n=1 Tax=Nonomuraea sp. G32 TaxID=3067274 RepID=UPI00273A8EFD|nr:hypothetical protein [Nonomuraea sp. G32]MDP4512069.1 hypothetical protein [Nonomuraea sp. G32]